MSFSLSGGVEVYGFISPTDITDIYPVIDPLYGIDGFRNVDTITDLNNIPTPRRRAGMVVGVSGGTTYYKLNPPPWNNTITDWSVFQSGSGGGTFTGGTVNGSTIFTNGLTANTLTVNGVSITGDTYTTGGTYSNGTIDFYYNTGGGYQVVGLYTGQTSYVNSLTTGVGLSADTTTGNITIINTDPDQIVSISGGTGILTGGTYPNFTIENSLPDQTVVLNNGSNISVTGTYPNFTIDVTGLTDNDIYVTGFTYDNNNTLTISQNSGTPLTATINVVSGLTVNGDLIITGNTTLNTLSATTIGSSGDCVNDIYVSNIHSCSPLNINPLDEGNVYFGSTSGVTIDLTNNRVGIGTSSPTSALDVRGGLRVGINSTNGFIGFNRTDGFSLIVAQIINSGFLQFGGGNVGTISFNGTSNEWARFTIAGNLLIGTTGDTGQRLQVSGDTLINGNLTATTVSAATYYNLPTDIRTTGATYNNNTFTFTNNTGGTYSVLFNTVTGLTVNGNLTVTGNTSLQGLTATTISAATYQNLPTDIRVTGASYNNNTFTFTNNTGGTFSTSFNTVTGLTVNGNLTVTGNTNVRAVTGTTALFSGSGQNILTIVGSGNSTTSPIFTVQGSSGELFSVTDSLVGSLYSVNDISGLPILEVFSDNTILMGSYLAPSLNTTTKVTATTGTTNVYSIPTSAYTGAFFDYTVSDGTNLRAGNIMSIWSGSSVNYTETQTTDFGNTSGLTFNMVVSSGNAILRTSGVTGNWTVKTIVRSI